MTWEKEKDKEKFVLFWISERRKKNAKLWKRENFRELRRVMKSAQ